MSVLPNQKLTRAEILALPEPWQRRDAFRANPDQCLVVSPAACEKCGKKTNISAIVAERKADWPIEIQCKCGGALKYTEPYREPK